MRDPRVQFGSDAVGKRVSSRQKVRRWETNSTQPSIFALVSKWLNPNELIGRVLKMSSTTPPRTPPLHQTFIPTSPHQILLDRIWYSVLRDHNKAFELHIEPIHPWGAFAYCRPIGRSLTQPLAFPGRTINPILTTSQTCHMIYPYNKPYNFSCAKSLQYIFVRFSDL